MKESFHNLPNQEKWPISVTWVSSPQKEIDFFEYKNNFSLTYRKNKLFSIVSSDILDEENKEILFENVKNGVLPFSNLFGVDLSNKNLPVPKYLSWDYFQKNFNQYFQFICLTNI